MSDTHLCSGCDTTFSLRGYHSHLLQTKDPLCRAVFDRLKNSYETYQRLEQAANSSDEAVEDINDLDLDINMEVDSVLENRNLEEVSRLDDDEHHEDDSELEDIGDMGAEWETGWEQPRDGAPQGDAGGEDPVEIRSDDEKSHSDSDNLKTVFTVHHLVVETTSGLLSIRRRIGKLHAGQSFEALDQQHFLRCLRLMG